MPRHESLIDIGAISPNIYALVEISGRQQDIADLQLRRNLGGDPLHGFLHRRRYGKFRFRLADTLGKCFGRSAGSGRGRQHARVKTPFAAPRRRFGKRPRDRTASERPRRQ